MLLATSAQAVAPHQSPVAYVDERPVRRTHAYGQPQPLAGTSSHRRALAATPVAFRLPSGVHDKLVDLERNPPHVGSHAGEEELQGWNRTLLHTGCGACHRAGCGAFNMHCFIAVSYVWVHFCHVWLLYTLRIVAVCICTIINPGRYLGMWRSAHLHQFCD